MRLFRCPGCSQLVFFENSACLRCGQEFGFDPATCDMRPALGGAQRRCRGGDQHCNWLVTAGDTEDRCLACRCTVAHPDGTGQQEQERWSLLEKAKRRLLHTLLQRQLPLDGLRFAFPAEGLTGHEHGLITVVLAEADDVERERRRVDLHEPYRTLTGHLRHESGHHYFERIALGSPLLDEVRRVFGDERADYTAALKRHYAEGPAAGWETDFVSAYATSHPSEDWAETWAHYLHIVDGVELAAAYRLSVAPLAGETEVPAGDPQLHLDAPPGDDFDELLRVWFPLTYLANSLNRSLGLADWYPFNLPQAVIAKLRLVHRVVRSATTGSQVTADGQPPAATIAKPLAQQAVAVQQQQAPGRPTPAAA